MGSRAEDLARPGCGTVSSPPIPFEAYPTKDIPLEQVIHIMVGDFQRILIYPEKGFAARTAGAG